MALQSQTLRTSGSASRAARLSGKGGSSSRDGQRRLVGFVLLGALVVGGGYWYLRDRSGQVASRSDAGWSDDGKTLPGPRAGVAAPISPGANGQVAGSTTPATLIEAPSRSVQMGSSRQEAGSTGQTSSVKAPVMAPVAQPSEGAAGAAVKDPLGGGAGGDRGGSGGGIPATSVSTASMPQDLAALVEAGRKSATSGLLVAARASFNRVLLDARTSEADRAGLRGSIAEWNQTLLFSGTMAEGDPLVMGYTVERGDTLAKIARKGKSGGEASLIARVNGLSNPDALKVGQKLKLLKGPFHAVVHKSAFRMDLYAGPTPALSSLNSASPGGAEPGWIFVRSVSVGLGADGITPIANFLVKDRSKLVNPFWVNPRTGEKFDQNDPKNPIGERWIGLEGIEEKDRAFTGYGVHGTIQPESIGQSMSMGCVRLREGDVELAYDLLMPKVSVVKIVP